MEWGETRNDSTFKKSLHTSSGCLSFETSTTKVVLVLIRPSRAHLRFIYLMIQQKLQHTLSTLYDVGGFSNPLGEHDHHWKTILQLINIFHRHRMIHIGPVHVLVPNAISHFPLSELYLLNSRGIAVVTIIKLQFSFNRARVQLGSTDLDWFLLFHGSKRSTVLPFHGSYTVPWFQAFYCSMVPIVPWFLSFHGSYRSKRFTVP